MNYELYQRISAMARGISFQITIGFRHRALDHFHEQGIRNKKQSVQD